MFRRRKPLLTISLLVVVLFAAACSRAQAPAPTATAVSTPAVPMTAGSGPAASEIMRSANGCTLINSSDLAHLFPPHNEIIRDTPKTGPVTHPPFSSAQAAGTETTCVFYTFHQPGKVTGWMLQVTYLVDTPGASAVQDWRRAWDSAMAQSTQPVSGLGDSAFASGARLFLRKGNTYLTFESADTRLDANIASDARQLIGYDKQLAADGLQRLK